MAYIPFGYDKFGREVETELEALYTAISYVVEQRMSLREAAEWISGRSGRNISHAGLSKRMKKEINRLRDDIQEESSTANQGKESSREPTEE